MAINNVSFTGLIQVRGTMAERAKLGQALLDKAYNKQGRPSYDFETLCLEKPTNVSGEGLWVFATKQDAKKLRNMIWDTRESIGSDCADLEQKVAQICRDNIKNHIELPSEIQAKTFLEAIQNRLFNFKNLKILEHKCA